MPMNWTQLLSKGRERGREKETGKLVHVIELMNISNTKAKLVIQFRWPRQERRKQTFATPRATTKTLRFQSPPLTDDAANWLIVNYGSIWRQQPSIRASDVNR